MKREEKVITSAANERVRLVGKLRSRSAREESGLFVIDGRREIERALAGNCAPVCFFYCPDMRPDGGVLSGLAEQARAAGAEILRCSARVMEKMGYGDRAADAVMTARIRRLGLADISLSPKPLLVVASAVEKPGNLGAIIRAADAAGADAVIVCDPAVDLYNPNVVRASTGLLFSVPVAESTAAETVAWLKANGIAILAATPAGALDYAAADMRGPVALVAGAEDAGLSEDWLKQADALIRIKMRGRGDSLNVAAAVSIVLFEAVRQREAV